jgi:hypothetical protein
MESKGPFYTEGRYLCEITDQGLSKASTGTVQIVLRFKVIEGTQPQHEVTQQYERTAYLSVTDRTMQYLVPKLHALGYTRDSLKFLNLTEPQCHDLRGQQADFYCKHEVGQQGGMREKWDVASQSESAPLELKPPDAKELRQLDMLFGKHLKETGSKPAAKPQPVAVQPSGDWTPTDDEVPF